MGAQPFGLVSGEAVEVEVRVARAGSRVLALLVDILVQIGLALALVIIVGICIALIPPLSAVMDEALGQGLLILGLVLVLVGYPTLAETVGGGRTLGKMAVGLRVVRDDGGPIQFRHALTRSLVGVALEWPGLVLPLITWVASLATMLTNPHGKRLGDLAAGTIVIHDRTWSSWGWVPGMPPALASWAGTLDLTGLQDDLALAIRHFLARGRGLVEPERSRLGRQLAAEVLAATAPPPPPGVPDWAYLAAVLAERHRRAMRRLAATRTASATLWPTLPTRGRRVIAADFRPGLTQPEWPSESWPPPPWLSPPPEPVDWTGLTAPPLASTLRPPASDKGPKT